MIYFSECKKDNEEFKWVALENLEDHKDNRQTGTTIYFIEELEEGSIFDHWEDSWDKALKYVEERFGVDSKALISTKDMVAKGHDMSAFYDLDCKT
ncbi:MAG: hypothetical protein ACFCU1_01995 [Sumerlaeia bacterium]